MCCCIIKHSNPCGFSTGKNLVESFQKAVSCDPISYFGGIVGINRKIDSKIAVLGLYYNEKTNSIKNSPAILFIWYGVVRCIEIKSSLSGILPYDP